MNKLHIGCGSHYREGWENWDILPLVRKDKRVDLTSFPWPAADDYFDEIYSNHVFEHLRDTFKTMKECHRILKPGGVLHVKVPYGMSHGFMSEPTHERSWTEITPLCFVNGYSGQVDASWGFELISNELCQEGMRSGAGGHMDRVPFTFRRFARNLIPFRHQLKLILFGMWDEVEFKLRKPK